MEVCMKRRSFLIFAVEVYPNVTLTCSGSGVLS